MIGQSQISNGSDIVVAVILFVIVVVVATVVAVVDSRNQLLKSGL